MARRKLQEVDASSIADIAFILLAFIIIATTLEKESGLPAVLPQKSDNDEIKPEVNERNILEILANKDNQLMIENQWDKELEDIEEFVIEFMTNPTNSESLPRMDEITENLCVNNIGILKANLESAPLNQQSAIQKDIDKWQAKLDAVKLVGPYRTVNKAATIAIQYDKSTSYGTYLSVRDEIMSGLNKLRDNLAMEKFGRTYGELELIRANKKTDEDKAMIKAIRQVYPQKIIKLPAKNVQ